MIGHMNGQFDLFRPNLDKAVTLGRADSINATPGQLFLVVHIEQTILETGRA
jgi:hypothetical protein